MIEMVRTIMDEENKQEQKREESRKKNSKKEPKRNGKDQNTVTEWRMPLLVDWTLLRKEPLSLRYVSINFQNYKTKETELEIMDQNINNCETTTKSYVWYIPIIPAL
jgi:hypothetical protein